MVKPLKEKTNLTRISSVLSLFTLVAFHWPFFRYSEASGFFSWSAVWYLLFLGVVPCIYIFARRFDYGSWKRFFARTGIALAVSLAIALINM